MSAGLNKRKTFCMERIPAFKFISLKSIIFPGGKSKS